MKLRVNGQALEVAERMTLLQATRLAGVEVPTLCHDDRLKPAGACRLCLVRVKGVGHLVPACATHAVDGMEVETHTPEIEETRRTLLELLAEEYPPDAVERWPEKQFHRWLRHYGITTKTARSESLTTDSGQVGKCESERVPASSFPHSHLPSGTPLTPCTRIFQSASIASAACAFVARCRDNSSGMSPAPGTTRGSTQRTSPGCAATAWA